jgi:hypothetical protein
MGKGKGMDGDQDTHDSEETFKSHVHIRATDKCRHYSTWVTIDGVERLKAYAAVGITAGCCFYGRRAFLLFSGVVDLLQVLKGGRGALNKASRRS